MWANFYSSISSFSICPGIVFPRHVTKATQKVVWCYRLMTFYTCPWTDPSLCSAFSSWFLRRARQGFLPMQGNKAKHERDGSKRWTIGHGYFCSQQNNSSLVFEIETYSVHANRKRVVSIGLSEAPHCPSLCSGDPLAVPAIPEVKGHTRLLKRCRKQAYSIRHSVP